MRYIKFNYLNTLPNKSVINKNNNCYKNLINKILESSDNTDNYILLNFRYKLIYILINKILDTNNNLFSFKK